MPPNPSASIVILTYNNLALTRQCLESLFQSTSYPEYEVIVVDNGSIDGTREFLASLAEGRPNLRIILNELNLGFAAGNNLGAAAARGEYLVFLNNDTVVTHGWLTGLLSHLEDPAIGLVGPVTNSIGNESRIRVDYEDLADMPAFAHSYTAAHRGQLLDVDMLAFFCVALRTAVFQEIGPLDERFGRGMFEDDDYALRLKQSGYRICVAEDVFVHHWGSASFSRLDTADYWQLFKHNLELFESKWDTRWHPPLARPEFMPERLREGLDASIYFTERIQAHKDHIAEIERYVNTLESQVEAYHAYKTTLDEIYASNGWALLQRLLRVRRLLVPEGSRRETLLRGLLISLRDRNLFPLRQAVVQAQIGPGDQISAAIWPPEIAGPADPVQSRHYRWPLVSVILPVYNHAHMLVEAANSVLRSSYPNFELIILDDGSSDDIEPVLRQLAINPRVKVYRQANQKLPRALTHAHHFARGAFITWTSADNRMGPGALTAMAQKLLAYPEAALVYADVRVIDEKGRPLYDRSYRPQNLDSQHADVIRLYREDVPLGFETDNYINACFLYRREAAEALDFQYADDLRGLEDYDFWLRLQKYGPLLHLENEEPLYEYRVHKKTMSHELLTREREAHLQRIQDLIDYEAARREFARRRWQLVRQPDLAEERWLALQSAARPLNIELVEAMPGAAGAKTLLCGAPQPGSPAAVFLHSQGSEWLLTCKTGRTGETLELAVPAGIPVSPLALKARDDRRSNWEFPQAGQRPVVGLHAELGRLAIQAARLQALIRANPQVFFVFVEAADQPEPDFPGELLAGLENAVYLGSRRWGEAYPIYSLLDAFWLPPLESAPPADLQRRLLALAYSTGRPLLLPDGLEAVEAAPFVYHYDPDYETLEFCGRFEATGAVRQVMDRYLQHWSPAGRLQQLLRLADTAIQEVFTDRPDFGARAPESQAPVRWKANLAADSSQLRVGLLVNQLDKGGLEQLVADLAERLPQHGVEPLIFCYQEGGHIAERLQTAGRQTLIAGGDPGRLARYLKQTSPDLIHSHWANLEALDVAADLGLPIIETIQNTYVWLGEDGWQHERNRSQRFQHAAAVSELVRRYYARFNPYYRDEWITTVPNFTDPQRVHIANRDTARLQLGIHPNDTLFLCLASYDARKNQLALLNAFDQASRQMNGLRLIIAGHTMDSEYLQKLEEYRSRLRSAEHIELAPYHSDPGALLAAADGFILNSFFEGWSLAANEALQAGLPLIHSDCGSGRELVGAGGQRGILVPNPAAEPLEVTWEIVQQVMRQPQQRNTEALTAAMLRLAEDKEAWQEKRTQIAAYSREHFGVANMVANYHRLYARHARRVL